MGLARVDAVEINDSPKYELEQKVRVRKMIRNDGTFPGKEIGENLVKKGDEGYVISIGTYLQAYYIYAVHFLDKNVIVGCRAKELDPVD
ncbi:nitrogen fixation protein NifZ [Lyngbya sp. PCC 8106]|uniref:nitrogen fixation protein NifZ n=1 Tax=Lyngbya sp. (strain PCC 8106) TaxID=313612 RepID=UPI0000EA8A45|nr:nitrogen fixation protein NifZ [Lyngbya sp. PCC 8106]EAW37228.1 NifZ [Lyngbya sp. PCC 8106]